MTKVPSVPVVLRTSLQSGRPGTFKPNRRDRESWEEWLLRELRHRYLALCGLTVHLYTVHASINDLDACYDPGRTYMVAAPWARLASP